MIEQTVTVIIDPITDLHRAWVDAGPIVIAIAAATQRARGRELTAHRAIHIVAVAIALGARERRGIAVLVEPLGITDLHIAGKSVGIGVITIIAAAVERHAPIAIGIGDCRAMGDASRTALVAGLSGETTRRSCDAEGGHATLHPIAEDAIVAVAIERAFRGARIA